MVTQNEKLTCAPTLSLPDAKAVIFMGKAAAVASCYTISARKWTYSSKQLTTHCDTLLRNGIKISGDAWWLFVHLCGIDAVEEMMAEPDFYPA